MSYANKFNKGGARFTHEVPEGLGYAKLEDLAKVNAHDKVYVVRALYINTKGKYGEQPLIITDEAQVNAPTHLMEVVKEIRADSEAVERINNGKFGFTIYEYEGKNGSGYSVSWCDID